MEISLDIRKQIGLSALGRLKLNGISFHTPALLIPINPNLGFLNKEMPMSDFLADRDYWLGMNIEDDLFPIHPTGNDKNEEDALKKRTIFIKRPGLWGIFKSGSIPSSEDSNQMKERMGPERLSNAAFPDNKIIFLPDNAAISGFYRFKNYETKILLKRLEIIEHEILNDNKNPELKVIMEFSFNRFLNKSFAQSADEGNGVEEIGGVNHINNNNADNLRKSDELSGIFDWIRRNIGKIAGIAIKDIFTDSINPADVLNVLFMLRNHIPTDILWIVSGKISPGRIGLALYCGFDIIDASYFIKLGARGIFITEQGLMATGFPKQNPCLCPICSTRNISFRKNAQNGIKKGGIEYAKINGAHERNLIIQHNLFLAYSELIRYIDSMEDGTVRTYIETQTHREPYIASFLRIIDTMYGPEFSARFPIVASHKVIAIGPESYHRPEVKNFIKKVHENITPAKAYKAIILLPCAAKKPYSNSKSHKSFIKVIKRAIKDARLEFKEKILHKILQSLEMENSKRKGRTAEAIIEYLSISYDDIHQLIVTSPLGLVPRELEGVFPAAHYDIPVTGHWDYEEIKNTGSCIANWLIKYLNTDKHSLQSEPFDGKEEGGEIPPDAIKKIRYDKIPIIAHLTGGYMHALNYAKSMNNKGIDLNRDFEIIPTLPESFDKSPSSAHALDYLYDTIKKVLNRYYSELFERIVNGSLSISNIYDRIKKHPLNKLNSNDILIRALFDYQFGKGIGDIAVGLGLLLIQPRNPNYKELLYFDGAGKALFGRIYKNTGLVKLTKFGGKLLHERGMDTCIIKITVSSIKGGSIFRPILGDIDERLHPEDEAIIVDSNGNYIGVGTVKQYGKDILLNKRGIVCSLRK